MVRTLGNSVGVAISQPRVRGAAPLPWVQFTTNQCYSVRVATIVGTVTQGSVLRPQPTLGWENATPLPFRSAPVTFGSELLLFAETQPEPQPGFPQGEGEPPNALKLIQKKLPPIHLNYLHSFNFIFSLKKVWLFETLLLTLHPKKKILGLYRIKDNRTRLHPGDLQAGHFFL